MKNKSKDTIDIFLAMTDKEHRKFMMKVIRKATKDQLKKLKIK